MFYSILDQSKCIHANINLIKLQGKQFSSTPDITKASLSAFAKSSMTYWHFIYATERQLDHDF